MGIPEAVKKMEEAGLKIRNEAYAEDKGTPETPAPIIEEEKPEIPVEEEEDNEPIPGDQLFFEE